MRKDITTLIDDVKYQSDSLTDLERLPVIQLNVFLAKINMITRKTTILLHYLEMESEKQKKIRHEDQKAPVVEDVASSSNEIEDTPDVEVVETEIIKSEVKVEKKKIDNVEDKLKQIAIVDLTTAIGINEKYLFASELFEGNIELYCQAVVGLNALESLDQAMLFLDELAKQYKWDQENESVLRFRDLVERRYNQL